MSKQAEIMDLLLEYAAIAHEQGVEDQACEVPTPCKECDRIGQELNDQTTELAGLFDGLERRAEAAEARIAELEEVEKAKWIKRCRASLAQEEGQ